MTDMENRKLKSTTNIKNSRVGKENTLNEVGLDAAQKFLESDRF